MCQRQGLFEERQTLVFWSDGGPHFGCTLQISNLGWHVVADNNVHVNLRFGVEHHMKGEVDAWFGLLTRRAKILAQSKVIRTMEYLHAAFRRCAKAEEIHEIVMPDVRREQFFAECVPLQPKTLPLPSLVPPRPHEGGQSALP